MIVVLIIGSVSLNIVQYINNKNLEKQTDTKQAAIEQLENQITDFESRIEESNNVKDYYKHQLELNNITKNSLYEKVHELQDKLYKVYRKQGLSKLLAYAKSRG